MKLDAAGYELIKSFEGLRLKAYRDIAGVWTIGYGSTYYLGGVPVQAGDTLSNDTQASVLLANSMAVYEQAVNRYVKVPLTQNQFNALVSFTYNEGPGALKGSTLLKKLNAKDYQGAANQLVLWVKITDPETGDKKICDTLVNRRAAERSLFLKN